MPPESLRQVTSKTHRGIRMQRLLYKIVLILCAAIELHLGKATLSSQYD